MKTAQEYQKRLQRHLDELKWLYCELYPGREDMFTQLCEQMEAWYQDRPESEKKLDREREQEPAWYSRQDMLGMMLYIDAFAGNLKGVKKKTALPGSMQRKLPASDAISGYPEGKK